MSILRYHNYDYGSLVVFGDKKRFGSYMKKLKGRWSSKLKYDLGAGWIVPESKREELDRLILEFQFQDMEKNARSRHDQRKYHRAVSASSDEHPKAKIGSPLQQPAPEPAPEPEPEQSLPPSLDEVCKRYSRSPVKSPLPPASPSESEDEMEENLVLAEVRKLAEQMKYVQRKLKKLSSK